MDVKEYKEPVKIYYFPGDTLFIYFQYNLVDPLQIRKNSHIVLIDRHKRFFLAGIDGYFKNLRDMLNWIKSQIKKLAPKKVVLIGCSSGGYSAILFGNLLGATAVYTFGATTCLEPHKLSGWGDSRYAMEAPLLLMDVLLRSHSKILQYLDLAALDYKGATQYTLFYSDQVQVDKYHAENLPTHETIKKIPVHTIRDHHIANIAILLPQIHNRHS